MWFTKIWDALWGQAAPDKRAKHDIDRLGTSCVRAVAGRYPKSVYMILNKDEWIRDQRAEGRYVIQDTQFKIGNQMRSVPKLRDVRECTLFRNNQQVIGLLSEDDSTRGKTLT